MSDKQENHNLMCEKEAAARLGVSPITLLRARGAGRIRFFRIGTRVLYCEEQITEFLNACERNGRETNHRGRIRKDESSWPLAASGSRAA